MIAGIVHVIHIVLALAIIGVGVVVGNMILLFREMRNIRRALAVMEQLCVDGEDFARRNRHAIAGLADGVEMLVRAVRPDLAGEMRSRARVRADPRHIEEEKTSGRETGV